jgi:ABC-2 type transport system ATP-binding protein
MGNDVMIQVEGLEKRFRGEVILTGVDMLLEKGKIYGLVGMNGSGKTVLMKCICGFLQPTEGKVTVEGKVIGKDIDFPHSLGLMLETPGFIPYMSGKSNLKNLALIKNKIGDREIEEAMQLVGLNPKLKKRVSKYSLGMRQRLGIAQAIMEKPELLILDEPFNGLDAQGVEDIRKLLMKLKEEGVTILLASHYDEDIRTLCEDVYLVQNHQVTKKEKESIADEEK